MKEVITTVKDWIDDIVHLLMSFVAVGAMSEVLFGSGVYEGPPSLPPSIRFVTHMQTPRATAVKALLQGLTRVLRVAK